jgi:hypothetical protein
MSTNKHKYEKFWMDDIRELVINNKYMKIFPTGCNLNKIEQLNAITRLCLYLIVGILLFGKKLNINEELVCLPIIVIVLTVIYYNLNINKVNKVNNFKLINTGHETTKLYPSKLTSDVPSKMSPYKSLYTTSYTDNPEISMPDYNSPNFPVEDIGYPPVASNSYDEDISEKDVLQLSNDLFKDTSQLWEKKNIERQFYSQPNNAIPNNQVEFAKWLYENSPSCKNDTTQCLRQTHLRRGDGHLNPY